MTENKTCDECAFGVPCGGLNVCTIKKKGKRVGPLKGTCPKWMHWSAAVRSPAPKKPAAKRRKKVPVEVTRKKFNPSWGPKPKRILEVV